jgi:tricorn protease
MVDLNLSNFKEKFMNSGNNRAGYYRFPTINRDTIVFACEDDLWAVPAEGGVAYRLTSNLGEATRPWFSADGRHLAFVGQEEGQPEVYVMPAAGGPARRLTFMGGSLCLTAGWTPDGKILFANNAGHWYSRFTHLYSIDVTGNLTEQLNFGPARNIDFGPSGGIVLGRNTDEPARWKRYRGGTAGQIWIDEFGANNFRLLTNLKSNLTSPIWLFGEGQPGRIFFISDHEGVGNLYSVQPSGDDLRRHTHHEDYYVRNAKSDGQRIIYHAGADLWIFDTLTDQSKPVAIEFKSPRTQRRRKFVDPSRYLGECSLHPLGQAIAITSRGKVFSFANWEGAVFQHGNPGDQENPDLPQAVVRYRLPTWLNDGKRILAITDDGGEERFVIFTRDQCSPTIFLPDLDIGRPDKIAVNPCKDEIVFSNHRYELIFLDLVTNELRQVDRGLTAPIGGFSWSPDGEWVAYSIAKTIQTQAITLWHKRTGENHTVTRPILRDVAPAFDPQGKYLYFLSYRTFDPIYDNIHFDLGFPLGMKPYLVTLQKDYLSPFTPRPRIDIDNECDVASETSPPEIPSKLPDAAAEKTPESPTPTEQAEEISKNLIQIDFEGIADRVLAFPVTEGIYGRILGIEKGKVLYSRFPIQSAMDQDSTDENSSKGSLYTYNFEDQKEELLVGGVSDFSVSLNYKWLLYRSGNRLRSLKIGEKPGSEDDSPSRKSGWLDLNRAKVSILPGAEWRQMFREAWRLQRDQFWTPDMSQVDWVAVHDRYLPLVDRISSRSEFSDLMWEMQGELGTSHAYEWGGDYRPAPVYQQGFLGADFQYDDKREAWKIIHIYKGDSWNPRGDSPLRQTGVNVAVGNYLLAINGRQLDRSLPPMAALVNLAGYEVTLTIQSGDAPPSGLDEPRGSTVTRDVTVKTLYSENPARYREWVESNRQYVHELTQGRVGYVHIPDMMGGGYAEFHRGYLAEVDREGLIIDVRYNRGGHVSALLLEKLARRRLGYDASRWGQIPIPYPPDSVLGPLVALTNEYAGSDGDIFSHGFKLMKLGTLIGKRTWGGVIGIEPRHSLVDGTMTTQPEYSFWFHDVGWGIENYGTDPDIDVEITPQDYMHGVDTQLDQAIREILHSLESNPPTLPDLTNRPSRALPKLPGEKNE